MRLPPIALALFTLISVVGIPLPEFSPISLRLKNGSSSQAVLAQTPEERKAQADQLLEQGMQQFYSGQFRAAMNSWQQALNLYQDIGDLVGEGIALSTLGIVYTSLGEYATAIDYQEQSLGIAREIGNRALKGAALGNLGEAYRYLGEYATAIDYSQQSLTITREIGDRAGEGAVLGNLGSAYENLGEYATAIEYHQQSLTIAREISDRVAEGRVLNNLGLAYNKIGEYANAIDYLQQSLAIAHKVGNRALEGAALGNLGLAYENLGEYATAIEYHQQSLTIAREISDRVGEGRGLNHLGLAYNKLGEYANAIDYLQQSLGIAREIGDRAGEEYTLNNLGISYLSLEEYATAIGYFQQSLAIAREIGDHTGEGKAVGNLGIIQYRLEEYANAIGYFQQSLTITREIGDRAGEVGALGNLGITYDKLGEYSKAIDYHQQSLVIAREIGDRAGEGRALSNLGVVFLNSGQLNEAEINLSQAIKVWETIREQLSNNDGWKVSIFEEQVNTYRWLQIVLIAQNRVEDALEISERGRARAFVELMAQRLGNGLENAAKVDVPNFEQIQQVAQQQNATLVEYSLIANAALYIWVIQPTGEIAFRSVDLTESEIPLAEVAERSRITASTTRIRGVEQTETLFTEMVRGTRDSIGNTGIAAQAATSQPRINRNLQQLHQLLIEPIADLLPSDPNQNIIFIPQGSLFLVPFAALQDEEGKYLIEKHTILTAPAIQVLELTQQQEINEDGEILIVGNPTMPEISIAVNQPPQQLTQLPGTEAEANAIASLLNAQTLIGDRATESLVKQEMPGARLIHLATHGLLEETDNGMLAAIALTPSSSDDGLLTPEEILSLDLNADLVVLSACDTGIGKITGDGVLGLSRSILTAGASSAIVSLWKVPDLQTSVLMSEFYRQWQQTGNKAQALRQAMLTTMQQYPHPMNWAAFTLMGEATTN